MSTSVSSGRRRAAVIAAAAVPVALMTASCAAPGPDIDAAQDTASGFARAVAGQNAAAACSMLAPETRSALAADGSPCQQALLGMNLPRAGAVEQAIAYGHSAQVVLRGDVVFLARFGDRWLITAAGCRSRGDRPYECAVSGG